MKKNKAPAVFDFLRFKREEKANLDSRDLTAQSIKSRIAYGLRNSTLDSTNHKTSKSIDCKDSIHANTSTSSSQVYDDPISKRDRISMIRAQTKMLEENAKRKELMIKHGNSMSVEEVFGANEFLIGAIESKLQLLKNIQ